MQVSTHGAFSMHAVRIAIATACSTLALSAEFPVKNSGFETWDANGKPDGWWIGSSSAYTVSADCGSVREGKCALKLQSKTEAATDFFPVGQQIAPGIAAGHRLRLSGFIRTRDVKGGWAGLWLRVDAAARPNLVLENMAKDGPRGTSEWRQFEISVPVAPNASQVAFGVLLSGSGTAWFDDLKLIVDDSVKVEKAEIPELALPPRPKSSQVLEDDAALAIATSEIPQVKDDWRADVRQRAQPIRSLFSDDFSDLQFLKPLLMDKRVVQLGESGHGVAEFSWLKVRLVKFLHQEMGFDVVAFESSLSGCDVADARIGVYPPDAVMRDCIFPVWHTSETLGLFEYLDGVRRAGKRISLAGFDTQNSGRARTEVSARLKKYTAMVDSELAEWIEAYEKKLAAGRAPEDAMAMKNAYASMIDQLSRSGERLRETQAARPVEIDLAIQEGRSRIRFIDQLTNSASSIERTRVRDEGMADNLDFVLDTLFPGRKVVVWAHNFHIAKQQDGVQEPRTMGTWVAKRRASEVYTIGLYMRHGVATMNDRSRYEIKAPPEDSLEAVLANAGLRMSFVDFSRAVAPGSWMHEPIVAREWGTTPSTITPAKTYDAVIYVDTVTPPEYR